MAVTLKGYTANYLGLSTDAKPTEADDNAIFRELDTGKRYYFTGAAWAEIPSSGGGGGGDVTSVNGKTGAVTLTASDVGAYTTAETDALLGDKQSKTLSASVKIGTDTETTVEGAIGEVAAIIPATAAVSNKLSTAADTAKEDITATANSDDIALTDAADARVHDLRIYGKTENGHSVGENGLTVTACGKNLFNINGNVNTIHYGTYPDSWYEETGQYKNSVSDGILTAGRNNSQEFGCGQLIAVKPSTKYTFSATCISFGSGNGAVIRADKLKATASSEAFYRPYGSVDELNTRISFTITTDSNAEELCFQFATKNGRNAQFTDIQMEEAAQVSDFEPYKESKVNITTALPLRRKMLTVDLGDFDWEYKTEHTYESGITFNRFATLTTAEGMFDPTKFTDTGNVKEDGYLLTQESCSGTYTVSSAPGGHEPIIDKTIIMSRRGRIYVIDNSYTDPAEFKAAVTGITLTYPSYCDEIDLADGVAITRLDSNGDVLATPVATPLSDTEKAAFAEFRTFDGNTNVTATDDPFMTLNYVKNTDNGKALADVDNKSAVRMAMIAAPYDDTATYAVGNYCTYGDRLWKCNTAIGTAEPFTAAHWTATTVMEEI